MFKLPNRIVLVKPVVWEGWLPAGHSGSWLNDGAVMEITVPISRVTGELVNPLTEEEKEYFENPALSGLDFKVGDLSPHKRPDYKSDNVPYWYKKTVTIRKPDTIVDNSTVLREMDLSNPETYLEYKILLANSGTGGAVAPSWEDRYSHGTHKLVLVDKGYEEEARASTAQDNIEAYKLFDKIQHSQEKLYDFLSVYWLEHPDATKPDTNSKVPFMVSQVEKIIQDNAKGFVAIMKDNYSDKLMVHNAIRSGVIKLYNGIFLLMPEETPVGNSLKDVIIYFKDDRHQEDKLKLIAQLEAEGK